MLMAAFGNTLLSLDAHIDPMRTPLGDSFDLATRLRSMNLRIDDYKLRFRRPNVSRDTVMVGLLF